MQKKKWFTLLKYRVSVKTGTHPDKMEHAPIKTFH